MQSFFNKPTDGGVPSETAMSSELRVAGFELRNLKVIEERKLFRFSISNSYIDFGKKPRNFFLDKELDSW
jgi:hypothetical protein